MDELVDKKGNKTGDIKDLGNGWWFTYSASADVSDEIKKKESFCAAGSANLTMSHEAKAVGEASSFALKIFGISLEVSTPVTGSVKIGPGPNITYDGAKTKLVTNSAFINTLTKLELTTAKHRAAVNEAKAVLAQIESSKVSVNSGGLDSSVSQVIQS